MRKLEDMDWWPELVTNRNDYSLRELAEMYGATPGAINAALARNNLTRHANTGGPQRTPYTGRYADQLAEAEHLVGQIPDYEISVSLDVPEDAVRDFRESLGIDLPAETAPAAESAPIARPLSRLTTQAEARLAPFTGSVGALSDNEIADLAGVTPRVVGRWRQRHSLPSPAAELTVTRRGGPPPAEPIEGEIIESDAQLALQRRATELAPLSDGRAWDAGLVAREIAHHTESIVIHAYEIGRRLLWAKTELGHGKFQPWIKKALPFSYRTAANYMRAAQFLLDRPELLEPMAKAGLKKTLLLTTLPSGTLDQVVDDGGLGEVDLSDIGDTPYVELKRQVDKLRKEKEAAEADRDAAGREVEKLKGELLDATAPSRANEEEVLRHLQTWREHLDGALAMMGLGLDRLARRLEEFSPATQTQIRGLAEYASTYAQHEEARFRALAGLDYTGAELAEIERRPRAAANDYALPAGRLLPSWDDDGLPPELQGATSAPTHDDNLIRLDP